MHGGAKGRAGIIRPARDIGSRTTVRKVGHPINPKIIGTAQDAQLTAALDLLKVPRAAAR